MDAEVIEKLKKLTIVALFSDDRLLNTLVLKGGNALSLVYDIRARASFDLDFSMEGAFDPAELGDLQKRITYRLEQAFSPTEYTVFDVKFEARPSHIVDDVLDFWGGYSLEFKVIPTARYAELDPDIDAIRREAIPPRPGGKARFEIDISKCEYCTGKRAVEMDDFTIYVYTPQMVVCEKIRAICQQTAAYASSVQKRRTPRARDFFDIHNTCSHSTIDLSSTGTLEIVTNMFRAKRVLLASLRRIDDDRDLHRQDWDAVRDTVDPRIKLREFEFYFNFVRDKCEQIAIALKV